MYLWYFRQAGPVQRRASLNRGLFRQWKGKGQTTTLGALFPTLCKKCMSSLMSPSNHFREEAGDSDYHLSSLSEKTRISNHLLMSKQRQNTLLSYFESIGPVWGLNPHPPTCQSNTLQHELSKRCSKRSYSLLCKCIQLNKLTNNICFTPRSGFQSFFNVFTQISPLLATFGWNILVEKNPEEANGKVYN